MKRTFVVDVRMIATCVSVTSWCLWVARLRFRNDQNFRKFSKFLKVVETIENCLENERHACRRGPDDCHVPEWHLLMSANGACPISKFCVCVIELSESFRAVTMVDGLPHAASGGAKFIISFFPQVRFDWDQFLEVAEIIRHPQIHSLCPAMRSGES